MDIDCSNVISNEDLVLQKLNEKYQIEFVVDSMQVVSILGGYYTAVAYPLETPDILFKVSVDLDGVDSSDNYVSKCIFREVSDLVGQNLDNLNGIFYIYSFPAVEDTTLNNPQMTLAQYLELYPNEYINLYIHYVPEQLDILGLYDCLRHSFDSLDNCDGMIYLSIGDEEMFDKVQGYLENHDQIYYSYKELVKPYYKGCILVKNGKIQCDEEQFCKLVEGK